MSVTAILFLAFLLSLASQVILAGRELRSSSLRSVDFKNGNVSPNQREQEIPRLRNAESMRKRPLGSAKVNG